MPSAHAVGAYQIWTLFLPNKLCIPPHSLCAVLYLASTISTCTCTCLSTRRTAHRDESATESGGNFGDHREWSSFPSPSRSREGSWTVLRAINLQYMHTYVYTCRSAMTLVRQFIAHQHSSFLAVNSLLYSSIGRQQDRPPIFSCV